MHETVQSCVCTVWAAGEQLADVSLEVNIIFVGGPGLVLVRLEVLLVDPEPMVEGGDAQRGILNVEPPWVKNACRVLLSDGIMGFSGPGGLMFLPRDL